MKAITLLLGSFLFLVACAPAPSGPPLLGTSRDVQTAPEMACASARLGEDGELRWRDARGQEDILREPYTLTCPDMFVSMRDGTLYVKAGSLPRAFNLFEADAFIGSYFADLSLRFDVPGELRVDDAEGVPESLKEKVDDVVVTVVQPNGTRQVLLSRSGVNRVTYDPSKPIDVYFSAARSPIAWARITVNATDGSITAYRIASSAR